MDCCGKDEIDPAAGVMCFYASCGSDCCIGMLVFAEVAFVIAMVQPQLQEHAMF
jgi:hypothetical protein